MSHYIWVKLIVASIKTTLFRSLVEVLRIASSHFYTVLQFHSSIVLQFHFLIKDSIHTCFANLQLSIRFFRFLSGRKIRMLLQANSSCSFRLFSHFSPFLDFSHSSNCFFLMGNNGSLILPVVQQTVQQTGNLSLCQYASGKGSEKFNNKLNQVNHQPQKGPKICTILLPFFCRNQCWCQDLQGDVIDIL